MAKHILHKIFSFVLGFSLFLPLNSYTATALAESTSPKNKITSAQTSKTLYGFSLQKTLSFKTHSVLEYQHKKSGAWLIVEKNNNINKKFEINVLTPPENDKGTNHIIEHCILNGSKEYPCKNIIWELSRFAHATFINAMTFPCYTTFPVASTDEDELESLSKIYMSGVFHPLFLEDERIFKKEGIRYEINSSGNLTPNGTVFNEMQNNINVSILDGFIKKIFADTQGKNFSGGIPEKIMDLTHEEICQTYKKYYKPSNMVIRLTGDINPERFMKWIDNEYLQEYTGDSKPTVKFSSQNPKKLKKYDVINYYKQSTAKAIINTCITYFPGNNDYIKNAYKLNIIAQTINNPNSARTKFLKEKGYIEVAMDIINDFYDPIITLELYTDNKDLASQKNIEKTIEEIFIKYPITQSEIDKILESEDFDIELSKCNHIYDKSVDSSQFMISFLRFGDPCSPCFFNRDTKENITIQSISETINNTFLSKPYVITTFEPCEDLSLSGSSRIKEKIDILNAKKDLLTQNYEKQKEWAETPNKPDKVNLIKKIFKKISDITIPEYKCPLEHNKLNNKNYYHATQEIGDFLSYKFSFKINHLSDEDKKYLGILLNAFYTYDTQNYSREELEKQKSKKLKTNLSFEIYQNSKKEKNAYIILDVICRKAHVHQAFELLNEQLNALNFKDTQNLKNFLNLKSTYYSSQPKALLKFQESVLNKNLYKENYLNGSRTSEDIKNFYENIFSHVEEKFFIDNFSEKLKNIYDKMININSLEGIGICSSEKNKNDSKFPIKKFINSLSTQPCKPNIPIKFLDIPKKNIACVEPTQSNNQITCILDSPKLSNDNNFNITCSIINNLFLMPNVREKGGAYGASIYPLPNEDKIIIDSYSDPNIESTIKTFKSIPQFLKNSQITSEEIKSNAKSLLGKMFEKNKLTLSQNQLEYALCTQFDYCKILNQNINKIKNITLKEIKYHGEILEKLIQNMRTYAVAGSIKDCEKALFDYIIE